MYYLCGMKIEYLQTDIMIVRSYSGNNGAALTFSIEDKHADASPKPTGKTLNSISIRIKKNNKNKYIFTF
ncbi:MAG: hypothetical protein LBD80_03510 [Tannerella sp.]|jgi:hypothetical protein|nr:hypothetical protein [Tannerella sp.]